MVSQGETGELTDTDRSAFVSKLRELKRTGSSLLVVGNVPESAATDVCHSMLGDETATDRRRLFVSTDRDLPRIEDRLSTASDRLDPETTTLVSWTAASRSAAAASPGESPQAPWDALDPVRVESDQLSALGIAIAREIDALEAAADGLSPSELRICFDSLVPLSSSCEEAALFRFLHVLIGRIRAASAMAHFHFPVAYDSTHVRKLAPLFDAVVELRIADGRPQQRWHLRDEGLRSGWLAPSASR